MLFPGLASAGDKAPLVLNSFYPPPVSTREKDGYVDLLVKEIFARAGQPLILRHYPQIRGLKLADNGREDGHFLRTREILEVYKNLRAVPVPLYRSQFVAVTQKQGIEISGWKSLAGHRIGHPLGWAIFDKHKQHFTDTTHAMKDIDLIRLMKNDAIDLALTEESYFRIIAETVEFSNYRILQPPLASRDNYIMLNKRHTALIPALEASILSILADGTYTRLCPPCTAPPADARLQ